MFINVDFPRPCSHDRNKLSFLCSEMDTAQYVASSFCRRKRFGDISNFNKRQTSIPLCVFKPSGDELHESHHAIEQEPDDADRQMQRRMWA
jgi:hypothetical protein